MEPAERSTVIERLEELEKQNRRMKHVGTIAVIVAGVALLMGQAAQKKTVEANEFILRDTNGKIRAKLDIFAGGPHLDLFDAAGTVRVSLNNSKDGTGLGLFDAAGKIRAGLTVDADADRPELTLSDQEGFEASIGTTELLTPRTGESHKTSAASVVLFGKDKKVIWQAP